MTFAVGLAAGYVLGSRAGRGKYEQVLAGIRMVRSHPAVQEAQQAARDLLGTGTDTPTAKLTRETEGLDPTAPVLAPAPRPPQRAPGARARRRV